LVLLLEVMHRITFACFWVVWTDVSKVLVHQTRGAFWSTAIPSSVQMLYSSVGVSLGPNPCNKLSTHSRWWRASKATIIPWRNWSFVIHEGTDSVKHGDAESECTELTMEESSQVENVWDDFASL
jgi:hypothetical protein